MPVESPGESIIGSILHCWAIDKIGDAEIEHVQTPEITFCTIAQ